MYKNSIIILCVMIGVSLHPIFFGSLIFIKGLASGIFLSAIISLMLIITEHKNNSGDKTEAEKRRRLQVLAERELFKTKERLALVIEGSCVGIWDWDLTNNTLYFSPIWKAQLGYEDFELTDCYETWEKLIHPDDLMKCIITLKYFLKDKSQMYIMFDHRLRHKDGSYRNILTNGAALRDIDGNVYRLAGSHTDITDLRDSQLKIMELELDKCSIK